MVSKPARFPLLPLVLLLLLPLLSEPPELGKAVPKYIAAPVVQVLPSVLSLEAAAAEVPPGSVNIIENCTVTWYTADTCGKSPDHPAYGITASGEPVEEGRTCAVDPEIIPLFSEVSVEFPDGHIERFQATDTGVKGNWVDIYTPDYDYAVQCGLQKLTVYWTPPEGG